MDILQEDNALSSLMGCFKLNVDQQKLVYDVADKIKIELKSKKEDFTRRVLNIIVLSMRIGITIKQILIL